MLSSQIAGNVEWQGRNIYTCYLQPPIKKKDICLSWDVIEFEG